MRNEVPGRRTLFLMLTLVLIVIVFWQLSAQRFSKTTTPGAGDVADVGPQTLEQMLALGKPGILEFYTSSCTYCARIAPELALVNSTYGAELFVVKMNAEKYPSEAAKYMIMGVPTLIYFDASGKEVAAIPGYKDFDELVQDLKQLKLID